MILHWILWGAIIFFSLLLSHNAILYFTHGGEYGILPEKELARQDHIWNLCFYLHLPAGILCILTPWYSFARRTFNLRNGHRIAGKIYSNITLLIVCPTGMYLALYAKGGLTTQIGFLLQGVLLAYFTYSATKSAEQNNIVAHIQNMIRSYAVATVVLTFRILHILFFILNVPYQDNYAISQWLGLSLNLLIAEVIIGLSPLRIAHTLKTK